MKARIRKQITIPADDVSPDSIKAAQQYATDGVWAEAEVRGLALDWNSFRTYVRTDRKTGDLVIRQWAKVL